jgi:3-deoxy-D-manno-octulosonate 8-phosphate phosphatase (KDO 8-P phosphatase)
MDVDGTLTNGKVYMGADGEPFKAFDIKDGCGIKDILPRYNITPVIITARESISLANRCKELGIKELHQGCRNKLEKLNEILSAHDATMRNVAYIGDDILDIPPMQAAKEAGGLTVCPKDAIDDVRDMADYVCNHNAGGGAIREFIDWLTDFLNEKNLTIIKGYSSEAYKFAKSLFEEHRVDGSYPLGDGTIANVMTYITKPAVLTCYESHKKYIDIQYIIYGKEMMLVEDIKSMSDSVCKKYDVDKDCILYNYQLGEAKILKAGDVVVLKPNDGHRGAMAVETPTLIRKIVFKVPS